MAVPLNFPGLFCGPREIVAATAPQDLTAAWAAIGGDDSELAVDGARFFGLWLDLDINSSQDVRVRLVGRYTTGGDDYVLPIKTVSSSDVKIEDDYVELNDDADQKIIISWDLDCIFPFVEIQVQAGVVGATAGQIDGAQVTTGRG